MILNAVFNLSQNFFPPLFILYGLAVVCVDVCVEAELIMAVGSDEGTVLVWSLRDFQLIHSLQGHTGAVLCVKVLPSPASHCLSLAADGSFRKWSLKTGQSLICIQEVLPLDPAPLSTHLHLYEQMVFVYTDTQVKVWTLDTFEHLYSCINNREDEDEFEKDFGRYLGVLQGCIVSVSATGLVEMSHPLRETQSVRVKIEIETDENEKGFSLVKSLILPKSGRVLLVSKGFLHQVSLCGVQSRTDFPLVPSLLSASDREDILIAAADRTVILFSMETESINRILVLEHHDVITAFCLSADQSQLITGSKDQLIRIWSILTGSLLDCLSGCDSPISSLHSFQNKTTRRSSNNNNSADQSAPLVLSTCTSRADVSVWNLSYDERHKPLGKIPSGCFHTALTSNADALFYTQTHNRTDVIHWNNDTGSVSARLESSADVSCVEVAQNKRLLVCGLVSGTVLIYPLAQANGSETLCIPPTESFSPVVCVCVSVLQEKHLVVAYGDLSVCLFELATRDNSPTVEGPKKVFSLSLLSAPLSCMSLCDQRLIYGTSCGEVHVHDFSSGSGSDLQKHEGQISCVRVGNWQKHFTIGSLDGLMRIYRLEPLTLLHTVEGVFFEGVLSAAFSDSDDFLFTGSQDRTIKVWSVATGALLLVQPVYSPVVRMETFRSGLVGLTERGDVIQEVFRCPDDLDLQNYNPLKNYRSQRYTVTSSGQIVSNNNKDRETNRAEEDGLKDFNPAQFNINLMAMLKNHNSTSSSSSSSSCAIL